MKLIDLETDLQETTDVSARHPEVVKRLLALAEEIRIDIGDGAREGKNLRPAGMVTNPKPLLLKDK